MSNRDWWERGVVVGFLLGMVVLFVVAMAHMELVGHDLDEVNRAIDRTPLVEHRDTLMVGRKLRVIGARVEWVD